MSKYSRVSDREVLEGIYDAQVELMEKIPYPSAEAMKVVLEETTRRQPKAKELSPASFSEPRPSL